MNSGSMRGELICFNCGRSGHFQIGCHFPPRCITCKVEGHTAAACPGRVQTPTLNMYGFGLKDLGFYLLEGGPEEVVVIDPNVASLVVTEGRSQVRPYKMNSMIWWKCNGTGKL